VPAIDSFVALSVAVTLPTPVTVGEAAATGTGERRPLKVRPDCATSSAGGQSSSAPETSSAANRLMKGSP
jgi:hypothetical protein